MSFKKGDIVVIDNLESNDKDLVFGHRSGLQTYAKIGMISEVEYLIDEDVCIKLEARSYSGGEVTGVWGHKKNFRKATDREKLLYYTHGENVLRKGK